jgi:hypothetical protein
MKKLLYAGFCAALLMSVGCALSGYGILIDGYSGEVINTSGKALITGSQLAVGFGNGVWESYNAFIDQKADGYGVITNYSWIGTDAVHFKDFTYCSPDWVGCSFYTEANVLPYFDGSFNFNCYLAAPSWLRVGTSGRYGECGNASLEANNLMNVLDIVDGNTLAGVINRHTTQLYVNSNGFSSAMNIYGSYPFTYHLSHESLGLDLSSPLWGAQQRVLQNWRENYQGENGSEVDLYYKGVHFSRTVMF